MIPSNLKLVAVLLLLCICNYHTEAQIKVKNPSFEDTPSDAIVPKSWTPCQEYTTPDILPGFWGVYKKPTHGNTYMGLITRENGTFESIGQRLSESTKSSECYEFNLQLSYSKIYAGYNKPIYLRIWLGKNMCDRGQLIYQSALINHEQWKKYNVNFKSEKAYRYILIEAFYKEDIFSHKGNILLDQMSTIKLCNRA